MLKQLISQEKNEAEIFLPSCILTFIPWPAFGLYEKRHESSELLVERYENGLINGVLTYECEQHHRQGIFFHEPRTGYQLFDQFGKLSTSRNNDK